MPRIHLLISIDPIAGGADLTAICGETVSQAQAIPLTEFDREQKSTVAFCKHCFGRQYFYAIATGQDSKDLEVA